MDSLQKPNDIKSYKKWLKEEHDIDITSKDVNYYDSVFDKATSEFKKTDFWKNLTSEFSQIDQKYQLETKGYNLFVDNQIPDLCTKKFDSVLDKSFRKNVLNNSDWPQPPSSGWVFPENWYFQINDLVRTCFVVKYLDGVQYLINEFSSRSDCAEYQTSVDLEAKEEGYYAAHFYIDLPCELPKKNWDTFEGKVSIELQITTQLQEVIRKLTHKQYEERRSSAPVKNEMKWQWDYKSDEFSTNYLGHILHYLEGMIMEVRDHKRKDNER